MSVGRIIAGKRVAVRFADLLSEGLVARIEANAKGRAQLCVHCQASGTVAGNVKVASST